MRDRTLVVTASAPATDKVFQQWMLLLAGSVLFILAMLSVGLPGAWLLGPMVAGIVVSVNGGSIRVSPILILSAQAVMGCMIAGLVTRPVLASFARQWPVFLAVTLSTLLASSALGWLLIRRRMLPGTTAIWGLSPGAATAMMLMAEAHGGDPRLVAFMQYLRVICVAFLASLIARFWIESTGSIRSDQVYFPALRLVPLAETLAIAGFGMTLARWMKIPSGALFVPMVAGSILQASGVVEIELPRWLLVGTFAVPGVAHRPPVLAKRAGSCRQILPPGPGCDRRADRLLRRGRVAIASLGRHRSSDGLSRHKSWRGRFGDRHRCVDERRHAVCHGIADRPFDRCAIPRTIPRAIRRPSLVNRRERHALQTQSAPTRISSIVRISSLRGSAARLIYACSACPLFYD
jgi:membrane AbrB-like protein